MTVDSCITYIIGRDDKWEKFRMKFTYFAGRYIGVETEKADGTEEHQILLRGVKADAISSAWKTDGSFRSDDERYNKIYDMVEKSVEQIWSVSTPTAPPSSGLHGRSPII